jgi:hypothetical protein
MSPELSLDQHTVSRKTLRLFLFECFLALVVVQRRASLPASTGWSVIMLREFPQLATSALAAVLAQA